MSKDEIIIDGVKYKRVEDDTKTIEGIKYKTVEEESKKEERRGIPTIIKIIFGLAIIGILLILLLGQQAQPQSVSRAVVCGNEKESCYSSCTNILTQYFCKRNCDKAYETCMNNYP